MINIVSKKWYTGSGEYIGRPSILGNPFTIKPSKYSIYLLDSLPAVINQFRNYLWMELNKEESKVKDEFYRLLELYKKNGELTLICWCKSEINDTTPCHGDVIKSAIYYFVNKKNGE